MRVTPAQPRRPRATEATDARMRAMLDCAFDGIVTIDHEGTILEFNAAAERTFGHARRDVVGTKMVDRLVPPHLREEHSRGMERYLTSGDPRVLGKRIEVPALHADGTEFPVELSIARVDLPGPAVFTAFVRDIRERKRVEALEAGQARLLELVAAGKPLAELLELVSRFVEEQSPGVAASILLLDPDGVHLRDGAAPSLPVDYRQAIDGVAIGPNVGSCGTAAYRREEVIVSDIASDPLWRDFCDLALAAGLRACWSMPILGADASLLGTFAMYHHEPWQPDARDRQLVDRAKHVVALAIEHAHAEHTLRASEHRYRDLFENATGPIATVTLDDRITDVNVAFERVLGYTRAELLGSCLNDYLTPEGYELAVRAGNRKLAGEVGGTTFEQEFVAKDGSSVVLEVSSRIIEEDGRPIGFQGTYRDVTAYKRAQAEVRELAKLNRHQALHDDVTGLPNRRCFRERIEQSIAACNGHGTEFAVLMIDLDRFKEINDALSHHCGDLVLVELARRLRSVVRHTDTIARLGGDEFGILVPYLAGGPAGLERTVERIRAALDDPFLVDGLPLHVEASIGIARYPGDGSDVGLLLQRADVAMHLSKRSGATHVLYAAERDPYDVATLTLLSELPRAIRESELGLVYQPKVDAQTGAPAGVEALVRWHHPSRGLIAPADFVPPAERTALIEPLTRFVLDAALAQSNCWAGQGHAVDIAVNLSMRNLHDLTLPDQIAGLLHKWDVPSGRLTLEITESAIVSDLERTRAVIEQLGDLGVAIAIDDFGSGYTSLAHLARLPVHQLKIDRSFVTNVDTDAQSAAIVRAIVALGHDLGLEVIAEGVETEEAHDIIAALGCDTVQGYHVSRPLPVDDMSRFLLAQARRIAREAV